MSEINDDATLESMSRDDLIDECVQRGLRWKKSKKPQLINRLKRDRQDCLLYDDKVENTIRSDNENPDDEHDDTEADVTVLSHDLQNAVKYVQAKAVDAKRANDNMHDDEMETSTQFGNENYPRFYAMTFRDVEESMSRFDGETKMSIHIWLAEFEDMSKIMMWNELQKLIYCKRLLIKTAKEFLSSVRPLSIHTYQKLKSELIKEFGTIMSSDEIHEILRRRRKQKDESHKQYVYKMMEIASRGNVEEIAVINYIIKGIDDDERNKVLLYGAKDVSDLKERFKQYERMKYNTNDSKMTSNMPYNRMNLKTEDRKLKSEDIKRETPSRTARCYNCGSERHLSNSCPDIAKGKKCFSCHEYGHVSRNCDKIKKNTMLSATTASQDRSVQFLANTNYKEIELNQPDAVTRVMCLLDTGSKISAIRKDLYNEIGSPELTQAAETLTGFASTQVESYGAFLLKAKIDNEYYDVVCHVVPVSSMPMKMLIGEDFLGEVIFITIRGVSHIIKSAGNDQDDYNAMRKFATRRIETTSLSKLKIDPVSNENLGNSEVPNEELLQCFMLGENETKPSEVVELHHILNREMKQNIQNSIDNYNPKKTFKSQVEMKIILEDERPVYCRPRKTSVMEQELIDSKIEEWLHEGIIRPSVSNYSSPVLLVNKKDESKRLCIDFRELNKKVVKDRYPLPLLEQQLDNLANSKIYTTLDLTNGFFHVSVEEESRKYLSMVTHRGQYEFTKAPFGFCNSPSVFQRYINEVFRELIQQKKILTYLDDIIILGKDDVEAYQRFKEVLDVAKLAGLQINWKKCQIMQSKVNYLGHVIQNGFIKPSSDKINAVMKYPIPKTPKELQSYLGLTGYFRKFIEDYAKIAMPLSNLLKSNVKFTFGDTQMTAFLQLKKLLSNNPVLKMFQYGLETELHTDASKDGYGAILLQRCDEDNMMHPVHYLSRKTTPCEQNYHSYELEVLAVIEGIKKFRCYLIGQPFKIITDCQAFQQTMDKKVISAKIARWAMMLQEFDYKIIHRAGKRMKHVDALSRNPVLLFLDIGIRDRIRLLQERDENCLTYKLLLKDRPLPGYEVNDDILYREVDGKKLIVVPDEMEIEVIKKAHEVGHFGLAKMKEILMREYYIRKVTQKIARCIESCVTCILATKKIGKAEGLLNPIPKGNVPLEMLHIDHLTIEPLATTKKGYKHILAIVDGFTKFTWLFPVKTLTTEETLQKLEVVRTAFGNPKSIMTDRGSCFTARAFESYCNTEGIRHYMISTGQPRGNGQVEIINRIIINTLTKLSLENPSKWYVHVSKLQSFLNSTLQRSIGMSPFEVMIGTKMRLKEDDQLSEVIDRELLESFTNERDLIREDARRNIAKIQEENRTQFNKKRQEARKYVIGDLVAIQRTQFGGRKLQAKYLGPYRIMAVHAHERYDVEKCEDAIDGPMKTTTSADMIKPWPGTLREISSGTDDFSDGRVVGSTAIRPDQVGIISRDRPAVILPCDSDTDILGWDEATNDFKNDLVAMLRNK